MTSLANQQQNLSFPGLLQVPGGITSTLQQVQDGNGNATGLSLSSTGASVATSSTFQASKNGITLTGATARLISDGFGDIINVKDFGAVGDGVTDDGPAIKAALDYANSIGGGSVYLPAGTYLKKDVITISPLVYVVLRIYSNTTLFGDGDSSIIIHDDKDTNPQNNLLNCFTGASNIVFRDFKILGTYYTYPNQTNKSQTIIGTSISKLRIENVTIDSVRNMAIAFDKTNDAIVTGCRLSTVQRDGFRFTQSMNVVIANNTAKWVGDNVVAIHTDNSNVFDTSLTGGNVVSNNVFESCLYANFLGAKKLTISNNQWVRCIGAINLSYNTASEGDTTKYAITVTGNTITDNFSQYGTGPVNIMNFIGNPRRTGGTTYPGQPNPITGLNDTPYGLYDLNNISTNKTRNPGDSGLVVANNIIKRTLPLTAAYSNYGFGLVFDPNLNGGFYDPAVTEDEITTYALRFNSSWQDVTIANNLIEGLSNSSSLNSKAISFNYAGSSSTVTLSIGSPCIVTWVAHGLVLNQTLKFTTTGALPTGLTVGTEYYVSNISTDSFNVSATYGAGSVITSGTQSGVHTAATYEPKLLENFNILNNTFRDCPNGAINDNLGASGTAINMTIDGNDFNLDPYYRNTDRVAGNKWTSANDCPAISIANADGYVINNNQFRNCSSPGFSDDNSANNIVFAQPFAIGFSANNRGVGTLNTPANSNKIIAIQGTPTLPNYEAITGEPLSASSTMPTTGTYVTGTFVANSSMTAPGSILGWKRITIGSNHVLGTDWLEVNTLINGGLYGTATAVASAKMVVSSTTQGFLPPVMTTTQKNAITTPTAGLIVFDSTLAKLCVYSGSAWQTVTSV